MMNIVTQTYTLRTWNLNDCASLAKHANNIKIWNNVRDLFPHPYSIADAEEFIGMVLSRPSPQEFAIEVDGQAVGGLGFVPGSDIERLNAEVGYWLGEAYWGRGIVSSALKTLADYIFEHTEIIRLFAGVYEHNAASMRVLEKAEFTKLAVLHKAAIKNNNIIDLHYYEKLKP